MHSIRLTAPSGIYSAFRSEGGYFIDLPSDFSIQMTRVIEKLSDFGDFEQPANLTITLDLTDKNRAILCGDQYVFPVEVHQEGEPLPIDTMEIIGWSDETRTIDAEVFTSGWIDGLEGLFLRDIQGLGTFEYTEANTLLAWDNPAALAIPAPAHWGMFWTPGDVTEKDLRFVFNQAQLIRAALATIGWGFECELLDGPYSTVYSYLSGRFWHWYTGKADPYRVDLNVASPSVQPPFASEFLWGEVSDPLDLYNNIVAPNQYAYPVLGAATIIRFIFTDMNFTLPASLPGVALTWYVTIIRFRDGGLNSVGFYTVKGSPDLDITKTVSFEILVGDVLPGDRYSTFLGYKDLYDESGGLDYSYTLNTGALTISPDPAYYIDGDEIPLADLLSDEINGLELLKGFVHLINGRVETDYVGKIVKLFPPFTGSGSQGYFRTGEAPLDITDRVRVNSMAVQRRGQFEPKAVELTFKESDAYISSLNLENVFARTYQIGQGKANVRKLENPLYNATLNAFVGPDDVGGVGAHLPHVWENDNGVLSVDPGPRVFINYGTGDQVFDGGPGSISFRGTVIENFVKFAQFLSTPMDPQATMQGLTFGQVFDNLFDKFYLRAFSITQQSNIQISVLCDLLFFLRADQRREYFFEYGGTTWVVNILALQAFETKNREQYVRCVIGTYDNTI